LADRKPSSPALRTAPAGQEAGRARVLEAARALFEEKGAAGLSMRAIAARAGMPTMTVYGYFPGKTAIIRALWSLAFGPLFEAMTAAEAKAPHARGRLDAAARAYVDYWLAHADRYRMVFLVEDRRERADDGWFIDQTDVVASYMRFGPLIANARGEPGADRTAEAEALICALTGVAHMAITVSEYPWRAPAAYVDLLVEGVCRAAR
jgi:AcrR family transcriptional regulator